MAEPSQLPARQGLYDPGFEHDACGIGFVASIPGHKSHDIIQKGIQVLINLTHRGACGCDPETGDGAGILIQIPHKFFARECAALGFSLPPEGEYGVGMTFLPVEPHQRVSCEGILERIIREEGLTVLGWRDTPVDGDAIGRVARASQPYIQQIFIGCANSLDPDALERKLYIVRKRAEAEVARSAMPNKGDFYLPSLSARTIVYKGLLLAPQITHFYGELSDPDVMSALCLVHQRFSTNTFPTWQLAHPFRYVAHNGEINTLRGNVNWMHARQSILRSPLFGADIKKLFPVIAPGGSDSANFDNALELLYMAGRDMPHSMAMLIPEAWASNPHMNPEKRAFYEYHASLMEPWDGPAAIAFTDGRVIGATLDRNGLRPARYLVTHDDLVVMSSETGVLPVSPGNVKRKGRLQPGKMFLVDTVAGRIISDKETKQRLYSRQPYAQWLAENQVTLDQLAEPSREHHTDHDTILCRQRAFGYTDEDLKMILAPMAEKGEEPVGSMGTDTPLACLSDRPQPLFHYFKQLFAQVTNPPVDPIREEMVMSLISYIGTERNILDETARHCHTLKLTDPILGNRDLEKLRRVSHGDFLATTLPTLFPVSAANPRPGQASNPDDCAASLERALDSLCRRASLAIKSGYTLLILSDRGLDEEYAPIPSLLALTAVHNHLVREETRTQVALIIESGEPREVMHFALLIGYGASAVNPYLAIETLEDMAVRGHLPDSLTFEKALANYKKAVNKGLLKTFSKMGISTLQSYRGAQVFEAIGLNKSLIDKYFAGTASRIEGVGLGVLAREAQMKHAHAFEAITSYDTELPVGGNYQYRVRGEHHLLNPLTISKLQHAVRQQDPRTFQEYTDLIDKQNRQLSTLRGLLEIKKSARPVSVEEVEPAAEIVKRFATGAMSFGSISKEAHETLAIAMNRIGGKSNTGEGGEDEARFERDPNGDWRRSAIKQVASARFGVTTNYLVNADELQIKMAQGAKPGEGGQLPGHKVDEVIARVRHSIPGVGLISPPPHHDIYSIEDLAQLIYDLKNVNPRARISVKLVAEVGVGTVAAGVAKAHADVVLISGDSGGTGASPFSSIKHAGIPWELGLAETQQVLVMNDLRGRIRVQTDGKLQTGRDVTIAALLGAEEFGFATTPLVAMGCIMMRKCHLNTCPVGIATQDPVLRAKFQGQPEHVINFFFFIAEQVRQYMAQLGFRTFDQMVGRVDMLDPRPAVDHWKAKGLDFSAILHCPQVPARIARRCVQPQDHGLHQALDYKLIEHAREALENQTPIRIKLPIRNIHRTVGAMLSGEIARRYGSAGLPHDTIRFEFTGSAGQSFGAFLAKGVTLTLEGDANDYVGKGLSGGRLVVYPPRDSIFLPEENILIGNVVLYGATSGEAYFNGMAGERFAVRNSGATAVVEGLGDHGCEYMTKGLVVVLGRCGRNFAAGMSGGVAYVLDEGGDFAEKRCNTAAVDLEPIADDKALLRDLITRHVEYTGSPRAKWILENWSTMLPKFIKVFPHEYKRVLRQNHQPRATSHGSSRMGKSTGFLEFARELPQRRPPAERVNDWFEIYLDFPEEKIRAQGARCMDCGVPFCHTGCPLTNIIPDWNDLVYRGRWREAIRVLHSTNNFPEFTGRICPAPCEAACVLGINEPPVTIKQIEKTIVDRAFAEGWIQPEPPQSLTGKRVAIVGSGPAGLAAAQQLRRAGHAVAVFEKNDRIGGLLRYGIPNFKMEKRVLDRRLEQMRDEGVEFIPNAHIGRNVPVEDLRRDYDAILLAGGAEQPRDLPVPGRELSGIYFAMQFLGRSSPFSAAGKRVVIIGGGDTGADCLGTSHRQKPLSVHQFELLPQPPMERSPSTPWPLWPMQLRTESSHEEGGIREWSVATTRFTGDEHGNVRQLHATRVGPAPKFEPVPGTEFTLDADLVLLAMGFLAPVRNGLLDSLGVKLDSRGNVQAAENYMTSVPGVFAAGDMRRGQSLVVWAIHEGRQAARGVDQYLMGSTKLP